MRAYLVGLVVAVLVLTGCPSLGLAPIKNFDNGLAYSYGIHTAVMQASGNAVEAGDISSAEAEQILAMADTARQFLDGARLLHRTGDTEGARDKMALATAVLTRMQEYLRSRGE